MQKKQSKRVIYSFDGKAEFSEAITPVDVSHDLSEISIVKSVNQYADFVLN